MFEENCQTIAANPGVYGKAVSLLHLLWSHKIDADHGDPVMKKILEARK